MMELATILKEHNLKVTPQRLSIFKTLRSTTAHPSAETIYTSLHDEYPTMSLATVYKTLDALVKQGLIQQLNLGEDSYRYDADTLSHPHIKCTVCHKVADMHDVKSVHPLRDEVANLTQFDLSHEQLYFYGICPDCKNHKH
ncbi:MAG: ferric uptake regulator, Fur family [Clostridia bacterium]|jgi:Fur family peroxide stress response transcriptional regulator|nr:ferric uptake regulator, Fur family [Clostridia bacterium]